MFTLPLTICLASFFHTEAPAETGACPVRTVVENPRQVSNHLEADVVRPNHQALKQQNLTEHFWC